MYYTCRDYNNRVDLMLQKLKEHPNYSNIASELDIDSSIFDSANSIKCEIEMLSNRLDMTFKQVERTLIVAQTDHQTSQQQQQQQQQYNT